MTSSETTTADHRHVPESLDELEGYRDQDVVAPTLPPCTVVDPELFDPHSRKALVEAKQVCAPCPIRQICLANAQASGKEHGVWGGEYFSDGVQQAAGFVPRPSRE